MKRLAIFVCTVILFSLLPSSYASEPIMITKSNDMDKVIFDGKWTTEREWKKSSWNELKYDGRIIHLRTAHQGEFIYILADIILDRTYDHNQDKVTVCFDSKNNKSAVADSDDFCFMVAAGAKRGVILQGGSKIGFNNNFQSIQNHPDFIAVGSISGENNRYSKVPHMIYEMRIPIELLGRSDVYGFYFSYYEQNSKKTFTWPQGLEIMRPNQIPVPADWGEIISPDKSLPEFGFPLLILLPAFILIILINRFRKHEFFKDTR